MSFPAEAAVLECYDMAIEIAEPQLIRPAMDELHISLLALKEYKEVAVDKRFMALPRDAREGIAHGHTHADDRLGAEYLPVGWEIHARENYVIMSTDRTIIFPARLPGNDPRPSPLGIMARGIPRYPKSQEYFDVSWRFVSSADTNETMIVLGSYPFMPDRALELGHVALDEAELVAMQEVYSAWFAAPTPEDRSRYCLRMTESGLKFLQQVLGAIGKFLATKS